MSYEGAREVQTEFLDSQLVISCHLLSIYCVLGIKGTITSTSECRTPIF